MAHIRTEFTDTQKARIYARDRATCCFSGANLWLLEAPVRPGFQRDWVDHVKPSARGGKAEIENGVCASHTFNAKKKHNAADAEYLFLAGQPTQLYFELFGVLPPAQADRLSRLSGLAPPDWYFNRAVGLAYLGFDWRCERDRYNQVAKRDDEYWFRAAFKKLTLYKKRASRISIETRGLAVASNATEWLELQHVTSYADAVEVFEQVFPRYKRNYDAWWCFFWDAKNEAQQADALEKARDDSTDTETIGCMEQALDLSALLDRPLG